MNRVRRTFNALVGLARRPPPLSAVQLVGARAGRMRKAGACLILMLIAQALYAREAEAQPYAVGVCLAARTSLKPRPNESGEELYARTIDELKKVASAIKQKVPSGTM